MVAGYGYATDRDAPDPLEIVRSAGERIDLIIRSVTPDLADVLLVKAREGCHARAIVEDADAHAERLLGIAGIEIHAALGAENGGLCRADEQMLLALRRIGAQVGAPPVIVVQRRTSGGLFDRLADEFEERWEQTAPLRTPEPLHAHLAQAEREALPDPASRPTPAQTLHAAGQADGAEPSRGALPRSRRNCRAYRRAVKVGAPEAAGAADRRRPSLDCPSATRSAPPKSWQGEPSPPAQPSTRLEPARADQE